MTKQGRIQRGFGIGQPVWDPRFLSQFKKKLKILTQPAITCSKLTIETLEQGVKYVQS